MTFTPIEIIALIIIVSGGIKMSVLVFKPTAWMNFANKVYSKKRLIQISSLVLAGIILYYLINSGLTIVQVLAVVAFVFAFLMFGLAPHIKGLVQEYKTQIKKGKMWKENWAYSILWLALMVWGALELFGVI